MDRENEQKKEYLRGYRKHARRVARIEAEIEELRSMKMNPSMNNDGMPHGSGQGDLSGYAAKIEEMEHQLINERYNRIKSYQEIVLCIGYLKHENEKDVLFYRYIKGLEWWEIADKMKYSERWIHEIHGKALKNFELPKDFIEVQ